MANPLNLHLNNITQWEIDQLGKVFHAANALCMSGAKISMGDLAPALYAVPANGYGVLSTYTFQFSEHIGDGKEKSDGLIPSVGP